jgi:hypothetical protein
MTQLEALHVEDIFQIPEDSTSTDDLATHSARIPGVPSPLHRLRTLYIRNGPAGMLSVLRSISLFKRLDDLSFELDVPEHKPPLADVSLLFHHLHDQLGKTSTLSSIFHWPVASSYITLRMTWIQNPPPHGLTTVAGRQPSTLAMRYHPDHTTLYQEHQIVIRTLEIEGTGNKSLPNIVQNLDEVILQPCVQLERVVFCSMHMTLAFRAWVNDLEIRVRTDGREVEVVYKTCSNEDDR